MSGEITVKEIRSIAESARPDLESYLNCNPINPEIKTELVDCGIEVECITGSVSSKHRLPGAEEHMFLEIPRTETKSDTPIIVDGALDQFCQENYDEGIVFQNLGPREQIPNPAVLVPSDELYQVYLYTEPY